MITCYFGLPGSGKTSLLAYIALRELKLISKHKSHYKCVFTTFYCKGCFRLDWRDLGRYYIRDALILIDEVTLMQDSRDWKNLSEDTKQFITLHRHFNTDIIYTVQDWSRCEKTLRENTSRLFYLTHVFPGLVHSRRIYRTIAINEYIGDLIVGYRFSRGLSELLRDFRCFYFVRRAWGLFDTHDLFGFDKKPDKKLLYWGSDDEVSSRPDHQGSARAERKPAAAEPDLIVDISKIRR